MKKKTHWLYTAVLKGQWIKFQRREIYQSCLSGQPKEAGNCTWKPELVPFLDGEHRTWCRLGIGTLFQYQLPQIGLHQAFSAF